MGFKFKILKAVDEEMSSQIDSEGKVIYGMQLEGARWAEERSELDEALPKVRTQKSYCYKSGKLIAFLLKTFRH